MGERLPAAGKRSLVMLGTFGLRPKGTMSARALPLARELAARGWRVRMVLPPWDCPEDAGTSAVLDGVDVVNVGLYGGPVAVVARMLAAAHAWGSATVHCFKPKGYGGLAAACLRLAGWPLVVDNDDWEGPGGWNDRVRNYSPAQRLLFAWQATTLPRSAGSVTVASRTLQTQAWAQGIAPSRVHYVPNGLSSFQHGHWHQEPGTGPLSRQALGLGDGPVLLLYTRFDVIDPPRVVAIMAALRARLPTAQLLIVGQGLAGEDDQVRAAAKQAGLEEALVWAGFVPFERLVDVLRAADVALYPIDDTLINRSKAPMKLLEVMAAGIPVVAEAVGETREYIENGVSGHLVEPGDMTALANVVRRLVASPDERQVMAVAARERVWSRFNWAALQHEVRCAYAQAAATVA